MSSSSDSPSLRADIGFPPRVVILLLPGIVILLDLVEDVQRRVELALVFQLVRHSDQFLSGRARRWCTGVARENALVRVHRGIRTTAEAPVSGEAEPGNARAGDRIEH